MKKNLFAALLAVLSFQQYRAQNPLAIPDTLSGTNFNLSIYDTSHVFYPNFTTQTFGINAGYLGPTLFFNRGDSVEITVNNMLSDTTTIHWHGLHVASYNDGGPHTYILPSSGWNPKFKIRDCASTFWYHPHLHMKTNLHATKGAAGMIIVRDSAEAALVLPRKYGTDDFPLVLQSKHFDAAKQIVTETAYDSVMMVNGTIDPYLQVPAQVVRFRLLNASSERVYNCGLQGNMVFYQVGSDGGLLAAPVSMTRLRLAPGERAEILVDFSGLNGQNINLLSFSSEFPNGYYGSANPAAMGNGTIAGYSANALNGADFNIMQFQVVASTANPVTTIPVSLVTVTPLSSSSSVQSRTLTFEPQNMGPSQMLNGPFEINNATFMMNVINYTIPFGNIETWTLSNQTAIAHPFHIHDVQFYILDINGSAPPANQQGRKDVVLVPAQQTVTFITQFDDFCDSVPYMYHCHMLPHEDDGMMGQFIVSCPSVSTGPEQVEADALVIFPNPATDGHFILQGEAVGRIERIAVSDISGRIVYASPVQAGNTYELHFGNLPSGLYTVHMTGPDFIQHRKIQLIR
ncbi:MAG: Bilirubin oxidase [Bacteroidetes bacterium]|nr:MAG: Bilirubin oxidase [Bacteroidota bacterium]